MPLLEGAGAAEAGAGADEAGVVVVPAAAGATGAADEAGPIGVIGATLAPVLAGVWLVTAWSGRLDGAVAIAFCEDCSRANVTLRFLAYQVVE